jgi:glycosyltransferase 2 family protein
LINARDSESRERAGLLITPLPLAMMVLVSAAVPLNMARWGPREAAAVWAHSAVGGNPATGLAPATAFGAMLPGMAVSAISAADSVRGRRRSRGDAGAATVHG